MAQTRITAGEWRGRLIDTPSGDSTRPTTSKAREALFNILGSRVRGARVLDLYAGAGSIGFEALSRGALSATMVEKDARVARGILATAERFQCTDSVEVVTATVLTWLRRASLDEFDICWLDPPYSSDEIHEVLAVVCAQSMPLVVCEHRKSRKLRSDMGRMVLVREANYGQTSLSFFEPVSE